jgi:hypothetical protein
MRVHLAREHSLELELLDVLFDGTKVALDLLNGGIVVLLDGKRQELRSIADCCRDAIQRRNDLLEPRALLAQLLRSVRRIPDRRIF